jgi:hypothetical protein
MEEVALPVAEVGPVDFWALRRLASICRRVDIEVCVGDRRSQRVPGLSYSEDTGACFGYSEIKRRNLLGIKEKKF